MVKLAQTLFNIGKHQVKQKQIQKSNPKNMYFQKCWSLNSQNDIESKDISSNNIHSDPAV